MGAIGGSAGGVSEVVDAVVMARNMSHVKKSVAFNQIAGNT